MNNFFLRTSREAKYLLGRAYGALQYRVQTALASVNERPILVLGNQKSGTTAIAALLAEYADLSVQLDLPMLKAPVLERMHQSDRNVDAFIRQHPLEFSNDVIKEPGLTFLYPALRTRFPDSHFVWIVRDPRDNIRSILNRHDLPGTLSHLSDAYTASISPEWMQVLDGSWMGLHGDSYIDMLAARWCRSVALCLEHEPDVEIVRYEDFNENKVGCIHELASRLSLSQVASIQDKVDIQYQPRGNRVVDWDVFFSPDNLRRIEHRCGTLMQELNYPRTDTLAARASTNQG
jgi:hypothetical protein